MSFSKFSFKLYDHIRHKGDASEQIPSGTLRLQNMIAYLDELQKQVSSMGNINSNLIHSVTSREVCCSRETNP